eukprot:TRINITY_DN5794_c0_g1_i13.p1 TRINITY_DN5794_c0_g1~~TRINITY_DN5794_c0_g1_i13.p1  ORF type:complete len:194 (-),score=51.14 TRINITY_DN5794_c0_g1_i13:114-695(-)
MYTHRCRKKKLRYLLEKSSFTIENLEIKKSESVPKSWKEDIKLLQSLQRIILKDMVRESEEEMGRQERVYCHSSTGEVMHIDDPPSDNEIDYSWVKEYENRKVDACSGVCDSDKAFFKLWNNFIHDVNMRRTMPIREMPKVCLRFCREYADKLAGMRENFLMHLLTLTEYKLLSTDDLYSAMTEFDKHQANPH